MNVEMIIGAIKQMQFTFSVNRVGLSSISSLLADGKLGERQGQIEYADPL